MTEQERQERKVVSLGTYSIPEDSDSLIQICPACGSEHDVSKMSSDTVTRLVQMNAIADLTQRVFEFVVEVAEKKTPMMTRIGAIERDTGVETFGVDLWAGIGETPITRLGVKNAEIDALKALLVSTKQEIEGQIEWFTDLREAIESGDKESALAAIDAEIKLLRRTPAERVSMEVRS